MKINTNYRTPALAGLSLIAATLTSQAANISVDTQNFETDLGVGVSETVGFATWVAAAGDWVLIDNVTGVPEDATAYADQQPRIVRDDSGNGNYQNVVGAGTDHQFLSQGTVDGEFRLIQTLSDTLTAGTTYELTTAFTTHFTAATTGSGDGAFAQARLYADWGGANQTLVLDTGAIGALTLAGHHNTLTDYSVRLHLRAPQLAQPSRLCWTGNPTGLLVTPESPWTTFV